MEDEGRQRTTKYLSHLHVDESDLLQHLVKEQERSDRLRTVGGEGEGVPKTPAQTTPKTPATPKTRPTPKTSSLLGNTEGERDEEDQDWEIKKKGKKGAKKKKAKEKKVSKMSLLKQSKLNFLVTTHSTPINSKYPTP